MARDAEALKVKLWAGTAEGANHRADPPSTLVETGWHEQYSQPGGPVGPERTYVNELVHRLTALMVEIQTGGLPLPWSGRVNYRHDAEASAFCMGEDGRMYVSLAASGPRLGNATNPVTDGQAVWRVY